MEMISVLVDFTASSAALICPAAPVRELNSPRPVSYTHLDVYKRQEKEALLSYLETLDSRTFLVIVSTYYNRQNHPPIPAFVIRIKEERGE